MEQRRDYKRFLKVQKANFIENEGRRIAEEAKKNPFIALRKKRATVTREITM